MSNEQIIHVTDETFEKEVTNAVGPVLLDFWAEWCGPCKALAPLLDEAAAEYCGKLKIVKLNVDENRATPANFGIRGIPTLMLFKGGEVLASKTGAMSKPQLTGFINTSLGR